MSTLLYLIVFLPHPFVYKLILSFEKNLKITCIVGTRMNYFNVHLWSQVPGSLVQDFQESFPTTVVHLWIFQGENMDSLTLDTNQGKIFLILVWIGDLSQMVWVIAHSVVVETAVG